jgi:hypothetical protein
VRATEVKADPDPRGGRIRLSWTNPSEAGFAGVKVLRREKAFPERADIGTRVEVHDEPAASTPPGAAGRFVDEGLRPETVYYYSVFAYDAAAAVSDPARASAMATAPYLTADRLYDSLPQLYRTYDRVRPPHVASLHTDDRERGQLRRFLDMFGLQFDLLRSFASGAQGLLDLDRVDGDLLPLLASWVGWRTNATLDFDKQRNEITYAPHFFRTAGVPANLRATLNRLVTWDAQVKEFVHNVLLSTHPEQLTVWQQERRNGTWHAPDTVTLDLAYEGRPAPLRTSDTREWLFYHARESAPVPAASDGTGSSSRTRSASEDRWHVWFKTREQDEWQPSVRLTHGADVNKHPAAAEDGDGRLWLFWTSYDGHDTGRRPPSLRLSLVGAGGAARPARVRSTNRGPFAFADGDRFIVAVAGGPALVTRAVTFRREHFIDIAAATAAETARLLDGEIPGVDVTADSDGFVVFTSSAAGAAAALQFPASPVAARLGLPGAAAGSDARAAEVAGTRQAPFALSDGDSIAIEVDGRTPKVVTFRAGEFGNVGQATAAEVVAAIDRALPGVARSVGGRVVLRSPGAGSTSLLVVDVFTRLVARLPGGLLATLDAGAVTAALRSQLENQGVKVSPDASLQVQAAGSRWLVVDGGRAYPVRSEGGELNVYDRALAEPALGFGAPVPAAAPVAADGEPSAFGDAAGRIWLFWSSRRNGRFKVWYDRCDARAAAWSTPKMLTAGPDADREPFALFEPAAGGRIWAFWSRKKPNGLWNVFYRTTTELDFESLDDGDWTAPVELTAVPADYDNREPAGVVQAGGGVELFFASNRRDGWHVWTKGVTTAAQAADARLTTGAFTHRAPAALRLAGPLTRLFLRTNRSQPYASTFYPSARTVDDRYSGSTTLDVRNGLKIGQRRSFQDAQRYTYDTAKGEDNWYARDTVGIYLAPDTVDQALVIRRRNQVENVLRGFLPAPVRTVLVVDEVLTEFFYTYEPPFPPPATLIGEQMVDSLLGEVFRDFADAHVGDTANFHWLRTWDETHASATLPDLGAVPPDLSFRLPLRGVGEEEP